MPHSLKFQRFVQLLQIARRRYLQQHGKEVLPLSQVRRRSRRQFLKQSAAVGIAGIAASSFPGLFAYADGSRTSNKSPRIAIVGGGLAGLNAAYQLKKAGYNATLFEGRQRLGGRVHSRRGIVGEDLIVEMGGEFINSDHSDMLQLVQDFNLTLFDRRADAANLEVPDSAYYFDGKSWQEQDLVPLLQGLVGQINSDAELIDQDWDSYAPLFDRYSVADYLDQYADLIPQPFIRTLIENTIRTEYGVEAKDSSALQLLFLLPVIDGTSVELLGYSDEIYTVKDGNSQLISAMANAVDGQIQLGKILSELELTNQGQYELKFKDDSEFHADYVIMALPFSALRHVEIKVPMPAVLKKFIRKVDLGQNEKLLAGYRQRVWRQAPGFSLEAWTDLSFSEAWDGSQRQNDKEYGALTYFLGANQVNPIVKHNVDDNLLGVRFSRQLAQYVTKLDQLAIAFRSTHWTTNPFTRGAYVNYRPGQLTQFGDYLWVESEDPQEAQSVSVGNLIFAGEHLSDEFYGFMNGAAQTGRLAANLLVSMLSG